MADKALSQAEVESLLSTMEGAVGAAGGSRAPAGHGPGGWPGEQVLPYDFKRPERIGKEQMRALQSLHEGFARTFGAELSALLRSDAHVALVSGEQIAFSEVVASLENPTCVSILRAELLESYLILEINPSILYPLIDRLLGGGNNSGSIARRPLTEIELRLAARITLLLLRELRKAWANVLPLNCSVERVETDPQLAQGVPPHEVVVLFGFEITLGEQCGLMNLCIPSTAIERISGKLTSSGWASAGKSAATPESAAHISREINRSLVELVVTLAETKISTGDLLELRVGDVITTDKDVRSSLDVAVQDVAKFLATPGALKGQKAIQIESAAQVAPAEKGSGSDQAPN